MCVSEGGIRSGEAVKDWEMYILVITYTSVSLWLTWWLRHFCACKTSHTVSDIVLVYPSIIRPVMIFTSQQFYILGYFHPAEQDCVEYDTLMRLHLAE